MGRGYDGDRGNINAWTGEEQLLIQSIHWALGEACRFCHFGNLFVLVLLRLPTEAKPATEGT